MGNWAFSWVQVIAHNKKSVLLSLVVLSSLSVLGFWQGQVSVLSDELYSEFTLLAMAIVIVSLLVGFFLESIKIGLLQLGLSIYSLVISLGFLGWYDYQLKGESILGLVVLLTLFTSNLIHMLSTLSREMARGLFQYDAIAEALKLNTSPVFLSNLTTALGFLLLGWVEPQYQSMATAVALGALISFLMTLSLLPWVLLSWLLEFRVGNTSDRHGLKSIVQFLKARQGARKLIVITAILIGAWLIASNIVLLTQFTEFFFLLVVFAVLFWLSWQSLGIALVNLVVNFLALLVSIGLFVTLFAEIEWLWLIWVIPLGIIVDDGIHFFSRYARAKYSVFSDPESAVTFAMASVGRPIWITSWVLLVALAVLLLSGNVLVVEAALLTMISLVVATIMILFIIPALVMSQQS